MDIIEGLMKLGSIVVDSMISTSKSYSEDKRFTQEGKQYYKELNEALTMAKGNLEEYKQKREEKFKRLQLAESMNYKLAAERRSAEILRVYSLIETHFGGFRGQAFEDENRELFHFFDKNSPIVKALLEYVKSPRSGQNFDVFPILALGITQNVWSGLSRTFKIKRDNFLVFCAEGVAFGGDKNSSKYTIIPYQSIEKIYRDERYEDIFLLGRIQYNDLYFKPTGYNRELDMPRIQFSSKLSEETKKLIASSMYSFIRCFNPDCAYEEKRGAKK